MIAVSILLCLVGTSALGYLHLTQPTASAIEKKAKKTKEAKEEEQKEAEKERAAAEKAEQKRSPGRPRKSSLEKAKDSFLSSLFRTIAREIAKLIMGSFKRK